MSDAFSEIAFRKLTVGKLPPEVYDLRAERQWQLLDRLELQLGEFETNAAEEDPTAKQAAAGTIRIANSSAAEGALSEFPQACVRAPNACSRSS